MFALEVKIWLILSWIIITVPIIYIFKRYFLNFFKILKTIWHKIEHRKNLKNIKETLIEKTSDEKISQESYEDTKITEEDEQIATSNKELLTKKLERIKYQAISLKEKWELDKYEQKLVEWLSYDSDNMDITKMLADYYFSTGYHKKALPLLKKILEKESNNHKAIWQIWQIYLEKEDLETAKLLISKAIYLKNDNPKYHVSMAEVMYSMEEAKEAIWYMENAVKLRPYNLNYLLATASLFEDIWENENSKKYYFKVLEIDPTNELAKEKLNQL